jgi:hypothetical protein
VGWRCSWLPAGVPKTEEMFEKHHEKKLGKDYEEALERWQAGGAVHWNSAPSASLGQRTLARAPRPFVVAVHFALAVANLAGGWAPSALLAGSSALGAIKGTLVTWFGEVARLTWFLGRKGKRDWLATGQGEAWPRRGN